MDRRLSGGWPFQRKTAEKKSQAGEVDNLLAQCAYLPVLCLVSYILDDGENPFLHFHAQQGLTLFLIEMVAGILIFVPVVGPYLTVGSYLLLAVAACWAVYHARHGHCRGLPLVRPAAVASDKPRHVP